MTEKALTLCVHIEALGWEAARRSSFLDDVLVHKSHLGTVFGPGTGGEPTVLTGRLPRDHGCFATFIFDPVHPLFRFRLLLRLLPGSFGSKKAVREKITRLLRLQFRCTGRFDLHNLPLPLLHLMDSTERHDIYRRSGIPGDCPTLFDLLAAQGLPCARSDWRRGETDNIAAIAREIATGQPVFAYLSLPGLDALLHAGGTKAAGLAEKLAWYEEQLRELCRVANSRYDATRLFVFSTFGMTDVSGHCDLMARIEATGLKFGTDYGAVYDSTLARFWILRAGVQERIRQALAAEPHGRIVTDVELEAWGADFPERRYGELFFLLNPGIMLCPSHMEAAPLAGMHGYAPQHAGSVATFMTNVKPAKTPRRLEELHGLILEAAGVKPGGPR